VAKMLTDDCELGVEPVLLHPALLLEEMAADVSAFKPRCVYAGFGAVANQAA
jgi:hypothetical protein